MTTAEDINTINAEEKQYRFELKDERNRILRMADPVKKQAAWNALYPKLNKSHIPY